MWGGGGGGGERQGALNFKVLYQFYNTDQYQYQKYQYQKYFSYAKVFLGSSGDVAMSGFKSKSVVCTYHIMKLHSCQICQETMSMMRVQFNIEKILNFL